VTNLDEIGITRQKRGDNELGRVRMSILRDTNTKEPALEPTISDYATSTWTTEAIPLVTNYIKSNLTR
jgi:hypothetical protein